MDVAKFLKDAKKKGTWEAGKEAAQSGFSEVPDGIYIAQLTQATFDESKSSGRPQIIFGFLILEGDQADCTKNDYFSLDGERSLEFLARRMKSMGIDPADVDDPELIPDVLDGLCGEDPVFKIKLNTRKDSDFQSVIVLKRLEDYEAGTGTGDEDSPTPAEVTKPAPAPVKEKAAAAPPKTKATPPPPPEPEQPPAADEDVSIEIGMKVTFTHDKDGNELPKPLTGIIKAFEVTDAEAGEGTSDIKVGLKVWKGISFEHTEFDDGSNGVDG